MDPAPYSVSTGYGTSNETLAQVELTATDLSQSEKGVRQRRSFILWTGWGDFRFDLQIPGTSLEILLVGLQETPPSRIFSF
jgi:hypothetical protein